LTWLPSFLIAGLLLTLAVAPCVQAQPAPVQPAPVQPAPAPPAPPAGASPVGAAPPPTAAVPQVEPFRWYESDFDRTFARCRGLPPAEGCDSWVEVLERFRPRTTDVTLPEWRRMTIARALEICGVPFLPPPWCPDWLAAAKAITGQREFQAEQLRLHTLLLDQRNAAAAEAKAWQELTQRVASGRLQAGDLEDLKSRGLAGNTEAFELLGWLYSVGQGVKRDYAQGYLYYARAVLRGRKDLAPTLDRLWLRLNETQKLELRYQLDGPPAPKHPP